MRSHLKTGKKKHPLRACRGARWLSYSHLLMTNSNTLRFIVHPSIFPHVCGRKPRELMRKIVKLNDAIYALTSPKMRKNSFETIQATSISLCNSSIVYFSLWFSNLYVYNITYLYVSVKHLYVYF